MPAQPESGMTVLGPVELHQAGVLEGARIPVGGREREMPPWISRVRLPAHGVSCQNFVTR